MPVLFSHLAVTCIYAANKKQCTVQLYSTVPDNCASFAAKISHLIDIISQTYPLYGLSSSNLLFVVCMKEKKMLGKVMVVCAMTPHTIWRTIV